MREGESVTYPGYPRVNRLKRPGNPLQRGGLHKDLPFLHEEVSHLSARFCTFLLSYCLSQGAITVGYERLRIDRK